MTIGVCGWVFAWEAAFYSAAGYEPKRFMAMDNAHPNDIEVRARAPITGRTFRLLCLPSRIKFMIKAMIVGTPNRSASAPFVGYNTTIEAACAANIRTSRITRSNVRMRAF